MTNFLSSSNVTMNNCNVYRSNGLFDSNSNEEDQLNRINLQALQNRDPYISKIIDQAQRVCVYKFVAEKRQWERKDLEGTLFVYERLDEPYHGFVILSTVSRETFVQIIKPSMEFKHAPAYEAFLQYKVDVGDIYGIWFISKNDCPRVTECLQNLTLKAKEREQTKLQEKTLTASVEKNKDILSLLNRAQEKFVESKPKQETEPTETSAAMPPLLKRLFSTQDISTQSTINKSAVSVAELEKHFLQPSPSPQVKTATSTKDHQPKVVPIEIKTTTPTVYSTPSAPTTTNPQTRMDPASNLTARLMTPADFQRIQVAQSPVLIAPTPIDPSSWHHQTPSTNHSFSRENLRQFLVDMIQNDEEFITGLHTAYLQRQNLRYHLYS